MFRILVAWTCTLTLGTGAFGWTVDRLPPTATEATISTDRPYDATPETIEICWQGFRDPSPGSGVVGYEYRVLPGDSNWTATSAPCATVSPALEGGYAFQVAAVDGAGNVSTFIEQEFCVDRTPPQTQLARIRFNGDDRCAVSRDLAITWGGFDDYSRCPGSQAIVGYDVRLFYEGQEIPLSALGLEAPLTSPGLRIVDAPEGRYQAEVSAIDRAGNRSATSSEDALLDATRPRILLGGFGPTDIPRSGEAPVTFYALLDDDEVGSVRIRYFDERDILRGVPFSLRDSGTNGDAERGDRLYTVVVTSAPETDPVTFLLELDAADPCGNKAMTWPYLTVE